MQKNLSTPPHSKNMQVFSRPTFDRIAKYIMSEDESIRVDILKAFTGIKSLYSAKQLDKHYNPFDPYSNLRKLIHSPSFKSLFEDIKTCSTVDLILDGTPKAQAEDILKHLGGLYRDLTHSFPDEKYRSTVDFLCETEYGYLTIEFQVAQPDYWDKRALTYVANIYGRQLRSGGEYFQIRDVIGVNLIGDGSTAYWSDGSFIQDYTVIDEHNPRNKIPSLRLIQYSLGDADLNHPILKENTHLRQWIEFFKSAHEKERMPSHLDDPVKRAYELIRVDILKKNHPDLLTASEEFFAGLTEHDEAVKRKEREEGVIEGMEKGIEEKAKKIARKMLKQGHSLETICDVTELDIKTVKNCR
jgi:predicted transposase/invertase (TIGR01784 family)